ncbi:DUF3025 domain-containing protein [Xanthomonadaceae bacterium JHOS43]|nr:DUF3025 domain-containing protein [Xanthomonadaceae bacterium JHOS43]MCX7564004.1 DUF3025 domain-containing protein [Xanthomonadaceae bacterium XH05]
MARTRFIAPARESIVPSVFDHPIHAGYACHRDLLEGPEWPSLELLNDRLGAPDLRFVDQDETLLQDGKHYESRIHSQGCIATRTRNWHDLFNALVWIQHAPLKRALNARQCADIARHGPRTRSRAQCALTHFDEAGVVVWVDSPELITAWDSHDWRVWFGQSEAFASGRIRLHVFGHALLEHALRPGHLPTAKALVVCGGEPDHACTALAEAIDSSLVLLDPQELRPLPLAGLPGWSPSQHEPCFFDADAFRPLRPGRRYPAPWFIE